MVGMETTGEAWVRTDVAPHKPRHIYSITPRGQADRTNLTVRRWLDTPAHGPRVLWQLSWALFRTHRTDTLSLH